MLLQNLAITIHSCPLQKIVLSATLPSLTLVVPKGHQLTVQAVTVTWLRVRYATSAISWSRVSFLIAWVAAPR